MAIFKSIWESCFLLIMGFFVEVFFDERLDLDAALDHETILYTDLADSPDPVPYRMIEALGIINGRFI